MDIFIKIKQIFTIVILTCILFALFATFTNFVEQHQRLMNRYTRDEEIISVWRTKMTRNVNKLCKIETEESHGTVVCETLPDPDPDKPD